jgi:hypothetical protein
MKPPEVLMTVRNGTLDRIYLGEEKDEDQIENYSITYLIFGAFPCLRSEEERIPLRSKKGRWIEDAYRKW